MATIWINGLDRIHRTQGILICHDFTATPFAPTGRTSPEDTLFTWIISDFNLNDAIESGLTKTPRIVIRDEASPDKKLRSKLYHIYRQDEVKGDLNRRAKPEEPFQTWSYRLTPSSELTGLLPTRSGKNKTFQHHQS
jgi:type III restriction enzyme